MLLSGNDNILETVHILIEGYWLCRMQGEERDKTWKIQKLIEHILIIAIKHSKEMAGSGMGNSQDDI